MADQPLQPAAVPPTLDATTPISLQRIMLATDFDPNSEAALHYSLSIARQYGSKVYLVHVVPLATFQMLSEDARREALDNAWRDAQHHMTDLLIAGHLEGVDHQVLVEQGDVWDVLSRKVAELSVDLLVVGTHGRSRIGKLLLGSVAETIFRQAPCPVLMVGPRSRRAAERAPGGRPILFCTGFSAHSVKAGGYALSLAQHQSACLIMLHVSKETPQSADDKQRIVDTGCSRLRALIPASVQLACPVQCFVEFGNAAERILAAATEHKPGVIVLGVRQPAGFARRLRWATAYEVVTHAPCPVLTVRMLAPE